jgi:transcriptional regulator with GAF, ATPase, and Fis domain
MQSNQQNRRPKFENQTERLETPILDLGREVNLVTLSNGRQLVYRSTAMKRLLEELAIFAPLQCDILIIAETGAGKELIAQAIHERSRRRGELRTLNCATIPESLAESLLFGHVKGAFTGAIADKKGLFEEAEGGTVFLDEFGELLPAYQAKILRVLEERKINRVGRWGVEIPVDVRIVAATNRDMRSMVVDGAFRLDLVHRFHKDVRIPPLRERPEDILPLANYFIYEMFRKGVIHKWPRLSPSAERALTAYDFPGNVRELNRIIFLAAAFACAEATPTIKGGKVEEILEASRWKRSQAECASPGQETKPEGAVEVQSMPGAPSFAEMAVLTPDDARTRDVLKALQRYGGNQAKAARAMGISRQAVSYHVKKFLGELDYGKLGMTGGKD